MTSVKKVVPVCLLVDDLGAALVRCTNTIHHLSSLIQAHPLAHRVLNCAFYHTY